MEAVPGVMNTPADVFSRLVEEEMTSEVSHVMIQTCSATQRDMIRRHHEWLCAHNGVDSDIQRKYRVATTTTRRPGVHSKMSDLSEDGSVAQDSGLTLFLID